MVHLFFIYLLSLLIAYSNEHRFLMYIGTEIQSYGFNTFSGLLRSMDIYLYPTRKHNQILCST
jgi:hypothetical protein